MALSEAVLAGRMSWDCTSLGTLSDRLHHLLVHCYGWDLLGGVLAVGIASPTIMINAALAAEGLSVDLSGRLAVCVPLYAITSNDPSRGQEVCRSTYAVAPSVSFLKCQGWLTPVRVHRRSRGFFYDGLSCSIGKAS